jgi:hypothetical protein
MPTLITDIHEGEGTVPKTVACATIFWQSSGGGNRVEYRIDIKHMIGGAHIGSCEDHGKISEILQ